MKVIVWDYLQVIFWSFTYALIILNGFRSWKAKDYCLQMPLLAGLLNLSWEVNAMIVSAGLWGHVLWLLLDVVIYVQNLIRISRQKSRRYTCMYVSCLLIMTAVLHWLFLTWSAGMLVSCFAIDGMMACNFLRAEKKLSDYGKISIAVTKFAGDTFAWLSYFRSSAFVRITGCIVFFMNLFYLALCLESNRTQERG